jgi:D-arabinose 1-dehydrogenase-like Zn-dependent alcohol dehydrogenase
MIAEARALAHIPDELNSAEAAPLVCAGITAFNALRISGLQPGNTVAIEGIGSLGHLGVRRASGLVQTHLYNLNGSDSAPLPAPSSVSCVS